jgi:hypothetical protein
MSRTDPRGNLNSQMVYENIDYLPEFRDYIPPLSSSEYNALKDSIKEHLRFVTEKGYGSCVRDKIVVWDKRKYEEDENGIITVSEAKKGDFIIIDGHNRQKIFKALDDSNIAAKKPKPLTLPEYQLMEFKDEDEVKKWMLKTQLSRRNLNETAKQYLIGQKSATTNLDKNVIKDIFHISFHHVYKTEDIYYALENLGELSKEGADYKQKILKGEMKVTHALLRSHKDDPKGLLSKLKSTLPFQ